MNKLILALALLLAIPAVSAVNFTTAVGGNITELNITVRQITANWQGFTGQVTFSTAVTTPGNVTATGSLVNGTNILFNVPPNTISATGFIIFSNASGAIVNLTAGNLTLLDSLVGAGDDSATNTFTQTSTFTVLGSTITGVPTTFTNVNNQSQNVTFREGYFNDAFGNLVFVVAIESDATGFDAATKDYQAILAAPNFSSVLYFLFSDLTTTQAAPPTAAGGGGGGIYQCTQRWACEPWTPCGPLNLKYRNCGQQHRCPTQRPIMPPTVQACLYGELPRVERPQEIVPTDILTPAFIANVQLLTPNRIAGIAGKRTEFNAQLKNNNELSVESVRYDITGPVIVTEYYPLHPFKRLFWDQQQLLGWSYHGKINPRVLDWDWDVPAPLEQLLPKTTDTVTFGVVPPAIKPQAVDLSVSAYSGDVLLRARTVPMDVDVADFHVDYEYEPDSQLLSVFFIIDNRRQEKKHINIELNIAQNRQTELAEYYGPYTVPANNVLLLAQEYKLSNDLIGDYVISARMGNAIAVNTLRID